jgi:hypothetical protein
VKPETFLEEVTCSFLSPGFVFANTILIENEVMGIEERIPFEAKFNPHQVRLGCFTVFRGRVIMRVRISGFGQPYTLLFYRSTGSHARSTGKLEGEWYVTFGFHENWLVKSPESCALTRGRIPFLTGLAMALESSGIGSTLLAGSTGANAA